MHVCQIHMRVCVCVAPLIVVETKESEAELACWWCAQWLLSDSTPLLKESTKVEVLKCITVTALRKKKHSNEV